jgi:predicted HAD superfamily Cof-like phosphohydrolase
MNKSQIQVMDFMVKAGQGCPDKPTEPADEVSRFRLDLIAEELTEMAKAMGYKLGEHPDGGLRAFKESPLARVDMVETYDAILDLLFVTIGAACALGLDIDPGWEEVVRSNMTKFIDGYRRPDGKWVKGPSYDPVRLEPIINRMKNIYG